MTIPQPAENQTQAQPAPAEPGFEVTVQAFWEKNRTFILAACAAALLVIVGREGWQFLADRRERDVRAQYARVADRPEQLAAFAAANPNHPLAGTAYLQIADAKYTAADYRQAADNYKKASGTVTNAILLGRAKIGAAMSQLNAGDQAGAETALKAIAADASLPRGARAEATYHLATLAHDAGNSTEVARLAAELNKIEPAGDWARQVVRLLSAKGGL